MLSEQIRSAYFWTTAVQVFKNGVGFVISLLLARLLNPEDYGLVSMVTVIIGIASMIQDWGLGQAVIYYDEEAEALPPYWTITAVTGLLLMVLTFGSAPMIAGFYGDLRLVPIMRALSLTFLLGGLRSVSYGLLTKKFEFRRLTIMESAVALGSGMIAVLLAWRGWGPWSLVVNILLQTTGLTALVCWAVPPRFTLNVGRQVFRKILGFGLPLTGSSLLWQVYENSDYLVIGKLLGSASLGQYTLGFRLATVANDKISSVINRVSFPSFAAMQHDATEVARHWFSVSRSLAWLNLPLLAALAFNAKDLVALVLGPKWLPTASVVKWLCIVGALKSFTAVTVNLVSARGRTDITFKFALFNAILLPISFYIGARLRSVEGVCMAWCLVFPVPCAYLTVRAVQILRVRLRQYLDNFVAPAGAAILIGATAILVDLALPDRPVRLFVRLAVGLICLAVFLGSQRGVRSVVWRYSGLAQEASSRLAQP